jgi:hypothetical protein
VFLIVQGHLLPVRYVYPAFIGRALYLIPLVTAMFDGVPWVTREFETGSFRYTWVQGISRTEWLLGTFLPLAATAALAATAFGFAAQWWDHDAQSPGGQAARAGCSASSASPRASNSLASSSSMRAGGKHHCCYDNEWSGISDPSGRSGHNDFGR